MAEDTKARARQVFDTFLKVMQDDEWPIREQDEEELELKTSAIGDDLPMDVRIHVVESRQTVLVISRMPVVVPEEKRVDCALAICLANNILSDGCFDFGVSSGRIFFRLSNCFLDSLLREEAAKYMLECSVSIIDEFNDKFLMLAKGMMSLEDFAKFVMSR